MVVLSGTCDVLLLAVPLPELIETVRFRDDVGTAADMMGLISFPESQPAIHGAHVSQSAGGRGRRQFGNWSAGVLESCATMHVLF